MGDGRWAMGEAWLIAAERSEAYRGRAQRGLSRPSAARPIAAERRFGGAPYNGIVIPSKAASVWGNRVLA